MNFLDNILGSLKIQFKVPDPSLFTTLRISSMTLIVPT